jgi:hypothetical protein
MKLSNSTSFPYPILGFADDVSPELTADDVELNFQTTPHEYHLDIKLRMQNDAIARLIESGKASYVVELDCPRTFFNRCFKSPEPQFSITLKRTEVLGRITVGAFIVVEEAIERYDNPNFSSFFSGYTFDLDSGDLLAAFPSMYIDTDLTYDMLSAAGSYMEIRRQDTLAETEFDFSGEKIAILLPGTLFELYESNVGRSNISIIHASLAFNALTAALLRFKEFAGSDRLWVRCVETRIREDEALSEFRGDEIEIPQERALFVAQHILEDPYKRLFNQLKETTPDEDD